MRTDYENYNTYDFTSQLISGQWVIVQIDLASPTEVVGTVDLSNINTTIIEVSASNILAQEHIDQIEAALSGTVEYTLTIQSNIGGTTDPVPDNYGPYTAGSVIPVTAIPDANYIFAGWLLDGNDAGTTNPINITMVANHTLIATFQEITSGEYLLYQSNFSTTLDPFAYIGAASGGATLLTATEDPLGTPSCQLMHNTLGGERASIAIVQPSGAIAFGGSKTEGWEVYESIRIKTTQMRTDVTKWSGIAHIRHPDLYGVGSSVWYAQLTVFAGKLRLLYYDGGTMQVVDFQDIPIANVAEDYELYVKVGGGDGVVSLTRNGEVLFSKSDVTNHNISGIAPSGSIGSLEIGTAWGDDNVPVYVYNITVDASDYIPLPTVTITGRVIDSNGSPIPSVGVRFGSPIDQNVPWNVKTFYAETYTDTNGIFQIVDDPDKIIPLIRLIKLGYGDPILPVGSVALIQNLTTPPSGTLNLGDLTLSTRTPIQPTTFPTGTYWSLRAITLFPFSKPYDSPSFEDQLSVIKTKQLPFNVIQLRTQFVGSSIQDMHIDTGQYSIASVMTGVDASHNQGFEAMISINGYAGDIGDHQGIITPDPEWVAKYKELVMQIGQECINHNVEYFLVTFENYFHDGQDLAAWIDIVNSLRALPGWNTKIGFTMNLKQTTNYNDWQNAIMNSSELWSIVDFLQYENWARLSTVYNTTEEMITQLWHMNAEWDDYHPDYPVALNWIKSSFPNQLLMMNTGFHNGDGCAIYPWSGSAFTSITNEEAQALAYKATFNVYQNTLIDGWNMEHYSFDPSTDSVHSCFNGMFSEEFIKAGLEAHTTSTPKPPPPPPTITWLIPLGLIGILGIGMIYYANKSDR